MQAEGTAFFRHVGKSLPLSDRASALPLSACDDDHVAYIECSNMLRLAVVESSGAFASVDELLFAFVHAHAHEPDVAAANLAKLQEMDLEQQHMVVICHVERFDDQLRQVAEGDLSGVPSSVLGWSDCAARH